MGARSSPRLSASEQAAVVKKINNARNTSKVISNSSQSLHYDNSKKLSNNVEGEKFLIIHRTDESLSMRNLSSIALELALKNATGQKQLDCKILKSGDILIKVEKKKQAESLIKLTRILDANVEVSEHKSLNNCKGVISAYELQHETPENLLEYLSDQKVIDVKFHTKTVNGTPYNTGLVFLTFGTSELPEVIKVGLLNLRVRPYIPQPMRCFICHKFGHISLNCNSKSSPKCYNCNQDKHIQDRNEKCQSSPVCVNCNENSHNSYNRNCSEYKRQLEIQTIRVTQKVSMAEAVKRSNLNRTTYAQTVKANSNDDCVCTHCEYHKKKEEPKGLINPARRVRTREENHGFSTDEDEAKKARLELENRQKSGSEDDDLMTE